MIKSVQELKTEYYIKHPDGHFFDRDTLKWFGERISDMRFSSVPVEIVDVCGKVHSCYTLKSLQRANPSGPKWKTHYFDVETITQVFPEEV